MIHSAIPVLDTPGDVDNLPQPQNYLKLLFAFGGCHNFGVLKTANLLKTKPEACL